MKRWLRLLIAVCILVLAASPAAFAQEAGSGTAPSVAIEGYQFDSAQRSCSFDVKLSGGSIRGTVFAALYAESGQMKTVVRYGAKASNNVKFQNVESADYVKAIWLDENQCPLAQDERNYQAFASAASAMMKAFSQFDVDSLDNLDNLVGVDGIEADFATARLIVSADETVDLSGFDVAQSLTDPDGRLILQFTSSAEAKRCHDHLVSLDSVNYAEADRIVKVNPQPGMSAESLSWGVDSTHIGAYAANLAERGVKNTVVVAVIDTGVDKTHTLLADRITSGYDFVDDDNEPQDGHSHGTHVSGTIVDCTPGMNVKIMPVRVLGNSGGGTDLNVGLGIRYAADHGANVINMSLGGGESSYIDECVAYAISQNVTVVVAAGNESDNTSNHCPAHIPACITVAAVDSNLDRAYFSNFGDAVDVSAPGVGIVSSVPGGGTASMSGTSMATPHVAAAAALLINDRGASQTPEQVSNALREAAKDLGDSGWDRYYGAGYLNMEPFTAPVQDHDYQALALDSNPNWKEAREICEGMGGHLATITSQAEQDKVAKIAASGSKYAYWIGGTDEDTEGVWTWVTGEPWEYTNWRAGEPNNTSLATASEENYVALDSEGGKWNDLGLNADPSGTDILSNIGFLCEWDGVRPSYSVSYDANGGSGSMSKQTVSAGDSVHLKANEFKRDGYHFVNWNTKADGSGKSYAAQAALTVTGALTLYARWEKDAGAYAVLYTDGELSFQNSDTPRKDKSYKAIYALDTLTDYALWYDNRNLIRSVTFTDKIRPKTTALWFYGCENLTDIQGLENLDTGGVTNMSQMFSQCGKLERLDLSALDTKRVTNMNAMFFSCGALKELDITGFDTASVTDMRDMFKNCKALSAIFASASFVTSNATNGADMFRDCFALSGDHGTAYSSDHRDASYAHLDGGSSNPGYFSDPNADGIFALLYTDGEMVFQNGREPRRSQPVAHTYTVAKADSQSGKFAQWYDERNDILSVTFAETIRPATTALWFCDCVNLKKISGLEKLDVSAVTNMSQMFSRCEKLTALDLSAWDVSKVTNMDSLFFSCSALETAKVSGWNTEKLASAKDMFKNCGNLRTIYATISFTTKAVQNSEEMFRDCNSLVGGRGTKFDASHIDKAYARLDGGESSPGYFTGTDIMRISFDANGGSGKMDDQIFYVGQAQKLNANQFTRNGYMFKKWNTRADGSGTSIADGAECTYSATGEQTYYAQWEKTEQSFTVSFDSMGGSKVDSQTVKEGQKAVRPENPTKDGYTFDAWYRNSDGSNPYDFDAPVSSNLTLYAGWKEVPGDTLYAFLYGDGLLVIQSGSEPLAGKTPVATYVTDLGGYNRDVEEVYVAWYKDRAKIKSVQINGSVVPTSTALWFYGCENLKAVNGLANLNTSAVTDMSQMFYACSGLITLDLAGLNTAKVTNMSQMFYACSGMVSLDISEFATGALTDTRWMFSGCTSLETIFASKDFVTNNVTKSEQMFKDCAALKGGKGTKYKDEVTDKTYARLDNPPGAPGYFTEDETGILMST